jgi:hypothetical protein
MGRRIIDRSAAPQLARAAGAQPAKQTAPDLSAYWDRLKNLIPAEVSAFYIAAQGVIPADQKIGLWILAAACLVFTAVFIAVQSQTEENNPARKYPIDWAHVVISCISFAVWVYALGGPFADAGLYVPWAATLVMMGWTFIVPLLYKGAKA